MTTLPPIKAPRSDETRIDALVTRLQQKYAINPETIRVVRAPLRISPLGAHIDHQLGHVTGLTIDRSLLLAFAPTSDGSVSVESLNFSPPVNFDMADIPPRNPHDWGNYIRGAALALQAKFQTKNGFIGVIEGNMPTGGLSSSAASTLAYLLAFEAVNGLSVSREENVNLVRYAENKYIGLNNGILDQTTILYSAPNQLTYINCKQFAVDHTETSIRPDDYDIMIVYSGVGRILAGTDYNNRVAECMEAAQNLCSYAGQPAEPETRLGDLDSTIFDTEGHRLPNKLQRRATHFFGEYRRVSAGLDAWRKGDIVQFGNLINESGESSIKYYESGSPQLSSLYEVLSQQPGVFGSRFSGAGFGGSCIALIDPNARESVAEAVHRHYPNAHPKEATNYSIHFCRSAGPVELVDL